MSKRFIETTIWIQNKWFRKMEPKYKLLWYYLISNCDAVGVWEEDLELASFIIGAEYKHAEILSVFNNQIQVINGGKKWWIVDFCNFQYGELQESTSNRPHQSYISLLKKHRLYIDYRKSIQRLKDKDKEKEQDKEQEKEVNIAFDVFWNLYDYKDSKERCRKYWIGKARLVDGSYIGDKDREAIMKRLPDYIDSTADKQYRRKPGKWLYNRSWEDEIIRRKNDSNDTPDYKKVNG